MRFNKIVKFVNPDYILTFTIKPNIYGGIVARMNKIKYIVNITGLGSSIQSKSILNFVSTSMYRIALKKAHCVFFQNQDNLEFMKEKRIVKSHYVLIPGSGVNLEKFSYIEYPKEEEDIRFLFIGRIMKEKGIDELLNAADSIVKNYPRVSFSIIGPLEEKYAKTLEKYATGGAINYLGFKKDVTSHIANSHALINPSYHEGMSNVLLEAAATGRPVIASTIPGCVEIFDEGVTGVGFKPKNTQDLVRAIIFFIKLPHDKKIEMGIQARRKMEKMYDRKIVIKSYLEEMDIIKKEV
jgi:galacturonosyltransferase